MEFHHGKIMSHTTEIRTQSFHGGLAFHSFRRPIAGFSYTAPGCTFDAAAMAVPDEGSTRLGRIGIEEIASFEHRLLHEQQFGKIATVMGAKLLWLP